MSYQFRGLGKEIRDVLRMTMIMMTGAFQERYQQPKFIENSAGEKRFRNILALLEERKINEAENYLIEWIKGAESRERDQVLQAAMYFYQSVNELTDEQLEQADYSREEILEGIQFGLETLGVNTAKGGYEKGN